MKYIDQKNTTIYIVVIVQSLSCVQHCYPWTVAHQASLSSTTSPNLLKFTSIESVMLSNHLILCYPLLFCLRSFPASWCFPVSRLFKSGSQTVRASISAAVFLMDIQGWFTLGLIGLISLKSKDSWDSSAAPYFISISSLALSLLYVPTLTSIYDHWKNHSFDYVDLC